MPRLYDELLIQPPASLTWKEGKVPQLQADDVIVEGMGLVCGSFGIANFGEGQSVTHLPTMNKISELSPLTIGQMKMAVAVLVGQLNWSKITRKNLRAKCPRWIGFWLRKCESAKQFLDPLDCPEVVELIEGKK